MSCLRNYTVSCLTPNLLNEISLKLRNEKFQTNLETFQNWTYMKCANVSFGTLTSYKITRNEVKKENNIEMTM